MFGPITIPFRAKMLFNTVKLKPGVTYGDVRHRDEVEQSRYAFGQVGIGSQRTARRQDHAVGAHQTGLDGTEDAKRRVGRAAGAHRLLLQQGRDQIGEGAAVQLAQGFSQTIQGIFLGQGQIQLWP